VLNREIVKKKITEMKFSRSEGNWAEADKIRGALRLDGVRVEIGRDGSIFWWYKYWRSQPLANGVFRATTIKNDRQRWALAHLLARTYEFRKHFYTGHGRYFVAGDSSYWTKEKLTDIFLMEDKLSPEDEMILERKMRSEGYTYNMATHASGVFDLA